MCAARDRLGSAGFECAAFLHADNVDAADVDTRSVDGGIAEFHGTPPNIIDTFTTWREAHEPGDAPILVRC